MSIVVCCFDAYSGDMVTKRQELEEELMEVKHARDVARERMESAIVDWRVEETEVIRILTQLRDLGGRDDY